MNKYFLTFFAYQKVNCDQKNITQTTLANAHLLSNGVKGRSCFIKDEDGRVLEDGSCYGHSLLLSPGQLESTLSDLRMQC